MYMSTAKQRRCNLFDDDCKPRRRRDGGMGCARETDVCHFVHPDERAWKNAQHSWPPPHDAVSDSDSDFYYSLVQPDRHREWEKEHERRDRDRERERERDWERERDRERKRARERRPGSPPPRKDSTSGPSPRRSAHDTGTDGGGTTTKRARSPTSSDQLEMLRKDSMLRPMDPPPSPAGSRSGDKGTKWESSKSPLVASYTPDVQSMVNSSARRPPEPPSKPPMEPPPPPPQLPEVPGLPSFVQPSGSANTGPRGLKELSLDEQRAAWHTRIDLMFTSIASRRDFIKVESELAEISLFSDSSVANTLPEADRANLSARKMALEVDIEKKRKDVNEIIQKLIGSQFWPVMRTPQISEMDKSIGEAKKHVLEVRALLDDVKNSCAALFKTGASDRIPDSERPSKRRRLEGRADTAGQSTGANAGDMTEATAKELEAFHDKFTELDRHLVDLEDEINRRDKIVSDEIELHIDARLEAEDALYPPVKEARGVSKTEIEAIFEEKNKEVVHAVSVTSEEVGILAVEVAELITKMNALEEKCRALEAENHEVKNKLAQDNLNHRNSQEASVRREKEIEAIAAALQAYIESQASAGQIAGDLPSAEYIMEALEGHLDGLFRERFCKTLVNIQQDVFDKVQESQDRTLNTISPKIMLLLKMVNLITARLGRDVETANAG